jgi:N-acetylmuramoyl-L-alanine amidase
MPPTRRRPSKSKHAKAKAPAKKKAKVAAPKPRKSAQARSTPARSRSKPGVRGARAKSAPPRVALGLPSLKPAPVPALPLVSQPEAGPLLPPLPSGMLRRGNRGASVILLQQALISLGQLEGPTNGAFGSATEEALCSFQESVGLPPEGSYNPATREALQQALARARLPVPLRPSAVSRPSPHHGPRGGVPVDALILHFTPPGDMGSVHYVVAPDGRLSQLVPDCLQTWHAGLAALHGQTRPSVNARSLGIEVTSGSGKAPFSAAQYRTLSQLVPYLLRRYAIPPQNVLEHRDVVIGRKSQPNEFFDWDRVRRVITARA